MDLIVCFIGAVIIGVILAWLRAVLRMPHAAPRTHGQSTEER
jgi:uncharacterized integral membrane protein